MKKHFASFVFFLLIATAACALAAPKLTNVTAESDSLRAGGEWALTFETTEGGALAMSLRGADGESVELGATQVDAGSGRLIWDGILPDGSAAADGAYTVAVRLRNYWGEESEESLLPLTIGAPEAGEAPGRRADTAKRQSWMRTSPGVRKTPSISGAATDRMP